MFQNAYVWLVFVSSLDVLFTWIVLFHHGLEVNPLANLMIQKYGGSGLVACKFLLVSFVILLCEIITRRDARAGRLLVGAAISLNSLPVVLAVVLLIGRQNGIFR